MTLFDGMHNSCSFEGLRVQTLKDAAVHALHLATQTLSSKWSVSLADTFVVISERLRNATLFSEATEIEHVEALLRGTGTEIFGVSPTPLAFRLY